MIVLTLAGMSTSNCSVFVILTIVNPWFAIVVCKVEDGAQAAWSTGSGLLALLGARQSIHTLFPASRGFPAVKFTRFRTSRTLSALAIALLSKTLTSLKTTMSVPGGGG